MLSGVGNLLSGVQGTRPVLTPFSYHEKTDIYNVPYFNTDDQKPDGSYIKSSTDEKRRTTILDNTFKGVLRGHERLSFVVNNGVAAEVSDYASGTLIVQAANVLAIINNITVGFDLDAAPYTWSGLSHTGSNWLWLSLVEEDDTQYNYQSSIVFRDIQTSFTVDNPRAPSDRSVLYATFTSGIGLNLNPPEKIQYYTVAEHAYDYQDPHGLRLKQQFVVCSGVEVINPTYWNYAAASGAPFVLYQNSLTYETNLLLGENCSINCSGLNLANFTKYSTLNILDKYAQVKPVNVEEAVVGTAYVLSGGSFSGTNFRNNVTIFHDLEGQVIGVTGRYQTDYNYDLGDYNYTTITLSPTEIATLTVYDYDYTVSSVVERSAEWMLDETRADYYIYGPWVQGYVIGAVGPKILVDGMELNQLNTQLNRAVISGIPQPHLHSIRDAGQAEISLYPKFSGMVLSPTLTATTNPKVDYVIDSDGTSIFRCSLGATNYLSPTTQRIYLRHYVPQGYTKLEKIDVYHKLCGMVTTYGVIAYPSLQARIMDGSGTRLIPLQGDNLTVVSGVDSYITISGISQLNIAPNAPWDLELTVLPAKDSYYNYYVSGGSISLSEIRVYYGTGG